MDEIDSKETPGIEGQAEAGAKPEISEDVKTEVASASGPEVAGGDSTGREGEGISESNEPSDTEVGVEDLVASGTEDSIAGSGDSPEDAATESSRQSVKRWCLRQQKKVTAGLALVRQHKKVIAGLALARQQKKVIAGLALGLLISPLVAYGLKHWQTDPGEVREKVHSTKVYRASTRSDSCIVLGLAAFVVLLPEDEDLAFFSLNISVKPSNSNVSREIEEKEAFFRAVIYGILCKTVKDSSPETMPKEQLKRDIIGALNRLLVTGTIDDVYFTKFLAV
jgi:flagellar basal body-associated protein FliL